MAYPAIDVGPFLFLDEGEGDFLDEGGGDRVLARWGQDRNGYVLFLSRLDPTKGVDDLIAGFARSGLSQSVRLVLAAGGPDAARLRGLAALSPVAERITFFADVDDDEKRHLMAGCTAYVVPSKSMPEFVETLGIALVQ